MQSIGDGYACCLATAVTTRSVQDGHALRRVNCRTQPNRADLLLWHELDCELQWRQRLPLQFVRRCQRLDGTQVTRAGAVQPLLRRLRRLRRDRDCGPPVPVLAHIAGAAAGPAGHAARASTDSRRAHLPSTSHSALGMLRLSSMALSEQEMASSNWPLASITPPRQLSVAVFSAFTSSCSYT
jgi:hypothetical protein